MPRRNESGRRRRGPDRPDSRSQKGSHPARFKKSEKETRPDRPFGSRKKNFSKHSGRVDAKDSARGSFGRSKPGPSRSGTFAAPPLQEPRRAGKTRFASAADEPKFPSGKRRPPAGERPDRRKGRGDSFGKPYKKSYKTKSIREGSFDRPPGSGHRRRITAVDSPDAPKSDKIRLNKYIANSGVSSRREADELITMGLISVNGKIITELGYKVSPGDEVRYEERVLRAEKPVYILMNKPKGFLTTTDDPQERKTVMHIVGSAVKERIYPVGRLDRNTTGLLLLTNDGDLADRLMHPSFNVRKVYKVELDKPLTKGDLQSITEGVRLEEGRAVVDEVAIVSDDKRTIGIELHIGWNRVVRRIFESLGYEVLKLDRTVYAGLDKKDLGRGEWRFLSREEIIHLKHFK